jgi:hypothetical protein
MSEIINLLESKNKLSQLIYNKYIIHKDIVEKHQILPDNNVEYDENFFETYKDRINWFRFSCDLAIDINIIDKFKNEIEKEVHFEYTNSGMVSKGVAFSSNKKIKWNSEFIDHYYDIISWEDLALNPSVPWDINLYNKYKDKVPVIGWNYNKYGLIDNKGIFWKEGFINAIIDNCDNDFTKERYIDEFSKIFNIEWNLNLLCKYWGIISLHQIFIYNRLSITFEDLNFFKDKLKELGIFTEIAKYRNLKWDIEQIRQFEDYIDFEKFSNATNINWTEDIFKCYINKWDFNEISKNECFCWSMDLLNQYKDKWDLKSISNIKSFPWTESLIEENIEHLEFSTIVENISSFISGDFIDKYKNLINWKGNSRKCGSRYLYFAAGISKNPNIEINIETLKLIKDKWATGDSSDGSEDPGEWHFYSSNKYINDGHLYEFADKLSWDILSKREDFDWTIELLVKFSKYWKWEFIVENKAIEQRILIPNLNVIKLYFNFVNYNKH